MTPALLPSRAFGRLGTTDSVTVDETQPTRPPLFPALIYLSILVVLVVVSWQTITHTTSLVGNVWSFPGDSVLGGLARYDGGWYLIVSTEGYTGHSPGMQSPVAFFPGYPLAMRLVGAIVGDNAIAGILITIVSGAAASTLFWSWCRRRMAATAATTSLLVLLLYPYSYVLYGAIYTEAFFLLATLIAFWAVENDRPLLAGVAGAIAAYIRPVGIAVAVGLAVRLLERRGGLSRPRWFGIPTRVQLSAARRGDSLVLLSVVGFLAYSGYLWARFGNPLLFASVERYWGHEPGPYTWSKIELYYQLRYAWNIAFTWGLVAQAILAAATVATIPLVGRRYGWGYAAYLLVVAGIPIIGTKDFDSVGRYLVLAFPTFALAGQALASTPDAVRRAVLGCSGLGLAAMMAGFAHGYYIA